MNDKFTIRDFFAIFMCGCAFYMALFVVEHVKIITFLKSYNILINDNSALIISVALPIIYLTGQIIQGIDTPFYHACPKIWKKHKEKESKFFRYLFTIICSHRISGYLISKEIDPPSFWKKCNELELVSKYGHSEYWYIMNDLFKGITLICLSSALYSLIKLEYIYVIGFAITTLIFHVRAKTYAEIFVETVISSRESLDLINPDAIK